MIYRSTFGVFLIFVLFINMINGLNPEYFQQHDQDQQLSSLIDIISNDLNNQHIDSNTYEKSETIDDNQDDEQFIKRNKYPNFHVSPLWLSRRTRTNRFYGKPLWISRTG